MKKKVLAGVLAAAVAFGSLGYTPAMGAEASQTAGEYKAGTEEDQAAVAADCEALSVNSLEEVRGNLHLPISGENGSSIQWESSDSQIITDEAEGETPAGVVTRQEEDVTVTLTATVTKGEASQTKVFTANVLAKPQTKAMEAYVFMYFPYTNQKRDERIYMATSLNGLDYTAVNDGNFILESRLGTHGLRDPFIIRSPEGDKFYMLATDLTVAGITQDGVTYPGMSWSENQVKGSKSIMVWESTNLVDWTDQRMCQVAVPTAGCAWAPEAYYDESTGEYIVFWASKVSDDGNTKQRIYYSKTRDFYNFTPAQVWIDEEWSVIDTTVIRVGDYYYRFSKNEAGETNANGTPSKRIYAERSDSMLGDWTLVNANTLDYSGGQIEGPCIFAFNDRDSQGQNQWCLMADATGTAIIPGISTDMESGTPTFSLTNTATMPVPAASHGTVIPVTAEEYDAVMKKWDAEYAENAQGEAALQAEQKVEADAAAVQEAVPEETKDDLTLLTEGENGSLISWNSDRTDVISEDGVVTRQKEDVTVTLTATITAEYSYGQGKTGYKTDTQSFRVRVPKIPAAGGLLEEAIALAETKEESDYTAESFAKLEAALAQAKAVAQKEDAAREELDEAVMALIQALGGLEPQKEGQEALEMAILLAEAKAEADYTPESFAQLTAALQTAREVAEKPNATQQEIQEATMNLMQAVGSLKRAVQEEVRYTIRLNPNGGTIVSDTVEGKAGLPIGILPAPVRAGYVFEGWYTASTGGQAVTAAFVPTKDMELFAHWRAQTVPTTAVTFENRADAKLNVRGTITRKATASPANATDQRISYSSSNPQVASVDAATGKVTAKAAGMTTITAACAGKTDSYRVLVKPGKVKMNSVKSPKKRRVTLRWKRVKGADGYEIQVAASKKKVGKAKPIRISKASTVKKTLTKFSNGSKLKSKKMIYVRMRAFTKAGSEKIYGNYSGVKRCRVK